MVLGPISNLKQFQRLHHCYRPIQYCDWYKPPNEIYYVLRCPICPKPEVRPQIVYEKQCKVCSFWEQLKDNCCGFFKPLPPLPMKRDGRVHLIDSTVNKKLLCDRFKLHHCREPPEYPKCPAPNWEVIRS